MAVKLSDLKLSLDLRPWSVAALSTAAAAFFYYAGGTMLPGGSLAFFQWADAIANGATLPPTMAPLDVGFPLLIWLSGYTVTDSLTGILITYASFAALMPLLVFWPLRPFSPWLAWAAALVAILSCGPYFFQKMLYHDQACIFFMMLTMCWLILFIVRQSHVWLYLFSAAAFFVSITRPAMSLVFPVFLLAAIGVGPRPRRWRHYSACLVAFVALALGYHTYRDRVFDVAHLGFRPSYTGQQIFYNPYINTAEFGVDLSQEQGQALLEARAKLGHALNDPTPEDAALLKRYIDNETKEFADTEIKPFLPPALLDRVWRVPNWEYMTLIDLFVDDRTLMRAAVEIIVHHPLYFVAYTARGAFYFLFQPGYAHTRYNTAGFGHIRLYFYPQLVDLTDVDSLLGSSMPWIVGRAFPERAQAEARRPMPHPELMSAIADIWLSKYGQFITATSVIMVLGWMIVVVIPSAFSRPFVASFAVATIFLLYNAVIVGSFAEPDYRYEAMVLVPRVVAAGFGLLAFAEPMRRWKRRHGARRNPSLLHPDG